MVHDAKSLGRRLAPLRPILLVGVVSVSVYALTIAPSLTWSHWGTDGGDFVTAAVTGRVPHPPGFPLYYLVSRILVLVAPGDPARLLNWLSASMACGAACWTSAAMLRRGVGNIGAIAVGLALAFSSWIWSQALIAEVYTTVAFFTSVAVYVASSQRSGRPLDSWWAGALIGLAASVHPTALGFLVFFGGRRKVAWMFFVWGLVVGLVPYVLLPFSGPWPQPWGDLVSLKGWWNFVTGRIYWGNAFALPLHYWPARALAWLGLMVRQFTPLGAALVLVGLWREWRTDRAVAVAIVAAVGVVSLYAIGYDSADSWVYLVAYLPLLALPLGSGFQWLVARGLPRFFGLAVPLALLLANWSSMDLHTDIEATIWLDRVLPKLPAQAVVLTEEDHHTFSLWYAVDALGTRTDLVVVDSRLWGYEPYAAYIARRTGNPTGSLEELAGTRPLCRLSCDDCVVCQ